MEIISQIKTDNFSALIFKIPIYDAKVCFIKHNQNEGYDEALAFLNELKINTEDYNVDDYRFCYGFTFKERVTYGHVNFILMNTSPEISNDYINTLSHENFHLVENICRHHGLERYKKGDNEHIAYLTGYLFDILYKL